MEQKEFEELSVKEVESLNGEHENESVLQAWRAGYIYFQQKVKQASETLYNEEFTDEMIERANDELDCFES